MTFTSENKIPSLPAAHPQVKSVIIHIHLCKEFIHISFTLVIYFFNSSVYWQLVVILLSSVLQMVAFWSVPRQNELAICWEDSPLIILQKVAKKICRISSIIDCFLFKKIWERLDSLLYIMAIWHFFNILDQFCSLDLDLQKYL